MFGFDLKRSKGKGLVGRARASAPIAAEFSRRSLRLLQLSVAKGNDAYQCDAAAEIPGWLLGQCEAAKRDKAHAPRVQEVLAGLDFAGDRISVIVPAECFQTDIARLPAMPDEELRESIGFEAQDRFGIDRTQTIIGHLRLGGTVGGQSDVLIVALPREIVETATGIINSPATVAIHLEHAALAALRGVARQRMSECLDPADAKDFAMIHLEDRVASLVLVREGAICFFRAILGDWASTNKTADRTRATANGAPRASVDEAPVEVGDSDGEGGTAWRWCSLAEEALRCLRHVERSSGGWWPREIVLTGPGACDPQAAATVESVCGVQSALAVPIRLVRDPRPCIHGNSWIATIGAACSELPPVRDTSRAERAANEAKRAPRESLPLSVSGARRDPPTVVTRAFVATQPKTGLVSIDPERAAMPKPPAATEKSEAAA